MAYRFRGYGALPSSFETPAGSDGLVQGIINNFLNQVPAGSPEGMNSRQLHARARELELLYGDLMKLPNGAEVVAAARGLELNLAQAWADIVSFAQQLSATLQTDPAKQLDSLGPRPFAGVFRTSAEVEAAEAWDVIHNRILGEMEAHRSRVESLTSTMKNSLANSLGPKLVTYVVSVSSVANRIRELEHAIIQEKIAVATGNRATIELATQKVQIEQQKVQIEQKKIQKAAAKLEGPSPLMIAAVAIPVLGVIAYVLTRKKSSVAGYRRRRSRR